MNVDGLSESTLEKIINKNLLHSILDLYRLKDHRDVLVKMDGFGEKSFENLVSSIEQSKQVPLANALYALGIKGIGLSTAKLIAKQFPGPLQDFEKLSVEDLLSIDGIGQVLADSFVTFFASEEIKKQVADLDEILEIEMPEVDETAQLLQGADFCYNRQSAVLSKPQCLQRRDRAARGQGGRKCQFQDDISCEQ